MKFLGTLRKKCYLDEKIKNGLLKFAEEVEDVKVRRRKSKRSGE
ncbi:MAG: hypothetical protein WC855_00160 [Thermodesulfovibrionales bacterium]